MTINISKYDFLCLQFSGSTEFKKIQTFKIGKKQIVEIEIKSKELFCKLAKLGEPIFKEDLVARKYSELSVYADKEMYKDYCTSDKERSQAKSQSINYNKIKSYSFQDCLDIFYPI
jgi:hypothetical protein